MKFYDAFSGIGGFRLGLERAGFECVGSCETDEYARQVYTARFRDTPETDIKNVMDIHGATMLCGGFPCQDVSVAGYKKGIEGERTGLWKELVRLITYCRPRWCLFENVPGLLYRGFTTVLSDLAACGYDAEWESLPASAFGAPHRRDRVWIVAYPSGERVWEQPIIKQRLQDQTWARSDSKTFWTQTQPPFFGVDDGVSRKLHKHRCRTLGNSVVPQIVEFIGRRILSLENMK